jgi:preprotein translocase SecE subunit
MARNRQKAKQRKAKQEAAAQKAGVQPPEPNGAPPENEGTVDVAATADAKAEIQRTAKLKPEPAKSQPKAAAGKEPKQKGRFRTFLRSSWAELRRVQWPDRKQLTTMTTIVIGFVIIAGAYLGVIDWLANRAVDFIIF